MPPLAGTSVSFSPERENPSLLSPLMGGHVLRPARSEALGFLYLITVDRNEVLVFGVD